jgi:putative tricarboxylic transport membrane protein
MDVFHSLFLGLKINLELTNLFLCFIGVLIGNLVGVLPGLGPAATIAFLLPITYKLNPIQAIIMLAGIYYGAQYGGSTTSILLNIPGEASSVVTCLDGYQMAQKGRAGAALGISAIGSFIGGTVGVLLISFLAPPLAKMALKFGPPENAALMTLGLTLVTYLSSGSMIKSLMMASLGLLLGCIGTDLISGVIRFTLNIPNLAEGPELVSMAMGLFGISEVLINIERPLEKRQFFKTTIKELLPNKEEFKDSIGPITRGSFIGFFLGVLPGGGALLSSFVSYALEKKFSKHPEKFGTGYIKGVAGPETANNSAAQGAYIPLMVLGIPCNVVMAVLMGAFLIQGVIPGPLLLQSNPNLFWGVVVSMYVGNVMLLILNLPLISLWVNILKVPYVFMLPVIILVCLIGSYIINNSPFDVYVMIVFGIIGYLMRKFDYPAAPLVLGLILGPMLERSLGQSLMMSRGRSPMIFFSSPISAIMSMMVLVILISPLILKLFKKRRSDFLIEEDDKF